MSSASGSFRGDLAPGELFHDLISPVSLNLDHTFFDGTSGSAEAFEVTGEFVEFLGSAR